MPNEKLKKLHQVLTQRGIDKADYATFEANFSGDIEKQRKLHDVLVQRGIDKKSFEEFQLNFFPSSVKKKPTSKVQESMGRPSPMGPQPWDGGQGSQALPSPSQVSSPTLATAPTAVNEFDQPLPDEVAMSVDAGNRDPYGVDVSMAVPEPAMGAKDRLRLAVDRGEKEARLGGMVALDAIRERRGTDFTSSAADLARGKIEKASKAIPSPMESAMNFTNQVFSYSDRPVAEQGSVAEFSEFSNALSNENREIGKAFKMLEADLKEATGMDLFEFGTLIDEINVAAKAGDEEKYNELAAQAETVRQSEQFKEMERLKAVADTNVKAYQEALASGRYDVAQQFGAYLDQRQREIDESYNGMSRFEKVANSTGRVILHTLAKIPGQVADLTDVVEKASGLEGDTPGAGDFIQGVAKGFSDDVGAAFPAPTALQRGAFTKTAEWKGLEVDFSSDGEVSSVRNKDGSAADVILSDKDIAEMKAMPRKVKFNSSSFAYQAGSTIADVIVQVVGTKGIGGLKAIPGVAASRYGVALKMAPLGTEFGMVATTAGMMAGDLYQEGLEAMDGDEESAARYALATSVSIGLANAVAGIGAESQFLKSGFIGKIKPPSFSAGWRGAAAERTFNGVMGGLGEVAEEMVLEKAAQSGVQYIMNETSGGKFDINPYKDTLSVINETALSFFAGGLFNAFKKRADRPNRMDISFMIDGSRDIERTVEAVRRISELAEEPMTPAEEEALRSRLELTAAAVAVTPEEHSTNPEVVEAVMEEEEIRAEIAEEKESIEGKTPSLTMEAEARVEALEGELEVAEQATAEAAGVEAPEAAEEPTAAEAVPVETAPEDAAGVAEEMPVEATAPEVATPEEPAVELIKVDGKSIDPETLEVVARNGTRRKMTRTEARKFAEASLDRLASAPGADLEGIEESEVSRKVLEEGNAAQVGAAWRAEPERMEDVPMTKASAIEEAVLASTFSEEALSGIPDISPRYRPARGERAGVVSLFELAEEISENTGFNVTEADLADYIRENPTKKKPRQRITNPVKAELAKRFKDLTGVTPTEEYVNRLTERAAFIAEKAQVEAEFSDAVPPPSSRRVPGEASKRAKKALLNRVVNDLFIPLEARQKATESGLTYDVLSDEHVNAVAEEEIEENMKSMDVKEGLLASVRTARDLLKDAIDAKDDFERETNGAVAAAILLKTAYHMGSNGMMEQMFEVLSFIDSYARGQGGRFISSLRSSALPEGIAGMTALRVFEGQTRELSRMGKNATLGEMIEGLLAEVRAARERPAVVAPRRPRGRRESESVETRRRELADKRREILDKIKANLGDTSLGIAYDPERDAERSAQLIRDVWALTINLIESGVTEISELRDTIVDSMKSIGFSEDDANRIAVDVLMREDGSEIGVLPSGRQVQMDDRGDLRGTVSPERIAELGIAGALPTGPQSKMLDQKAIDEIVDAHYDGNPDGRSLAAKLEEAGMAKKESVEYEQRLKDAIEKKSREKIVRAMEAFKKKIQEEQIEGLQIHEAKWKGAIEEVVAAVGAGVLTGQAMNAAVAQYFGFPRITPQNIATIKGISQTMISGLQVNAVINAQGKTVGYQPVGFPPPPSTTLQLVKQKSPELMARAEKAMKLELLRIERGNVGLMPLLARELHGAMHMGALSNITTWSNVIIGTTTKLLPELFFLTASSPLAAIRGIQAISKSKANNWKMGFGLFRDAWNTNFSHLNSEKVMFDGQYTSNASLMEACVLKGLDKRADKLAKAKGISKGVAFGHLMGGVFMKAFKLASLPMMIDGQLTHPVTEYVRFIETWNSQSEGLKFTEKVKPDFAKKVAEYGQFTEKAWSMAKQQAAAEVAYMKVSGQEVPIGFEDRRSKEIIYQSVRRAEVESSLAFMNTASLRGEMSGFLGVKYDEEMNKPDNSKKDRSAIYNVVSTIVKATVGMFLRVAIFGMNAVYRSVPLAPLAMDAAVAASFAGKGIMARAKRRSTEVVRPGTEVTNIPKFLNELIGSSQVKFVGVKRMNEYPLDQQVGGGFVVKSTTEKVRDFGSQALATILFTGLFFAMFDEDEEGNLILDPDRWIDISATLDNNPFNREVEGMEKYSIRYRQSDGTWSAPMKFSLFLPFVGAFSVIGGLRDDLEFRREEFLNKGVSARAGATTSDIVSVFSEVSFNGNAQTIGRFIRASKKADIEDSVYPYFDAGFQTGLRPVKALLPGVYRDLIVNELGAARGEVMKKPQEWYESIFKDVPLLDSYISGEVFDEYGNPVFREYKSLKVIERMSFGIMDFKQANEKVREQPEWKLTRSVPGLVTPGAYYPSTTLKIDGEKIDNATRLAMSKAVAEGKRQMVIQYIDQLEKMNKPELEMMLQRIHDHSASNVKFEFGASKRRPKRFSLRSSIKSVKEKIKKDNED